MINNFVVNQVVDFINYSFVFFLIEITMGMWMYVLNRVSLDFD